MGRRNRERVERIRSGAEIPISAREQSTAQRPWRRCGKCGHYVAETLARQHIKDCWGTEIKDSDPIPETVPKRLLTPTERQLRKYGGAAK